MRKRSQRRSTSIETEQKQSSVQPTISRSFRIKKSWWVPLSLIAIFLLVLLLNTYFNVSSGAPFNEDGQGFDKYYLAGPDPYYNMRIVEQTLYGDSPGVYPFYGDDDPLLNYPLGRSGGRAPLMNMMAIGLGTVLTPFMDEIDAVGIAMQFLPAIFGALLVFPVYFIGKTLFGVKEGLLGALFVSLIPIHLGSGHGSAYALFDHDSLNLFLFFVTYLFIILAIKEKDTMRSILYSLLAGMPLAGLSMVWTEYEYLYTVIAIYAVVQMLIDIFTSRIEIRVPRSLIITLFTGYLISFPVIASRGIGTNLPLYICIGTALFGVVYYTLKLKKIPWTLSLPGIFGLGAGTLAFLYFVPTLSQSIRFLSPLNRISSILYGAGIYGNKVSQTIAEAGVYGISRTVMSFGPALFWLAWIGFIFIGYYYLKNVARRDYLFFLLLFIIQIWFLGVAGRFINDLVPLIAIFGAWVIIFLVQRFDYVQMLRSIQSAGGGWRGLKKGISFLHVFGVLFIALIVVLPNAYLSMDAAVPDIEKEDVFGDLPYGAFGSNFLKEEYWVDAYTWFSQQDIEIENPVDRPAFISWWDYGFYEVAIGGHPTVADNFQDGIPPAANFHTSTSEQQAVSVWLIRLLEGNAKKTGSIDPAVITTLESYMNSSEAADLVSWVEEPTLSPSYGQPIAEEYNPDISKNYPVGEQWPENAVYNDGIALLSTLSDENLTMLYHDIQGITGTSIRYYGVEGYDEQIFNIFGFLADKSLLLVAGREGGNTEDQFEEIIYITQNGQELTYEELTERSEQENRNDPLVDTREVLKQAYFDTMFYRTYIGFVTNQSGTLTEPNYQIPCLNMKHFYAQYISPYPELALSQGKSAVVIAKYYEGAIVNGTVTFENETKDFGIVVQQNISHYSTTIAVDHDASQLVNGSYEVLVPAGTVTLQVRRYPELQANSFPVKNVTLNASDPSSQLAPITEEEATRQSSSYHRTVDIAIDPGNLSGYVYSNNDNDSAYNATIDKPLSNVEVSIFGISSLDPNSGQPLSYDSSMFMTLTTDEQGYYNTTGLIPGYYQIVATNSDGFYIDNTIIPVYAEDNFHDIAEPKSGDARGTVFFDSNQDTQYNAGEEFSGATIDLIYTDTGEDKLVDTMVTDETGSYEFLDLVPGSYQLNLLKLPEYETTRAITIQEDQTTIVNVSMQYAKVTVSGVTKEQGTEQVVGNITIGFIPDQSIENNTATQGSVISIATGSYSVELSPGVYNVTVNQQVTVDDVTVTYIYQEPLNLEVGEGSKTHDIFLVKVSD